MKTVAGSVFIHDEDKSIDERMLMTFDPEEIEQIKIAKNNVELLGAPEFIKYDPIIARQYNLSHIETLLLGYVYFFLKNNSNKRFYFVNSWLAKLLNCSDDTITRSFKTLKNSGLVKLGHKIKSGGGLIRFVSLFNMALPQIRNSEPANTQGIETKTNREPPLYISPQSTKAVDNRIESRMAGVETIKNILKRRSQRIE